MKNSAGVTTNAIYGFTTMLLKVIADKPDYLAIAFDLPEPTFRHKVYKEYKGTRDKAPPTLYEQMPHIKAMAKAFGIPVFEVAGFEADDVIGTLAKAAEQKGLDVTILSGDRDPLQLVNDKIKVLYTRKGITDTVLYGPKEVKEKYGLKPTQLIDHKALKGDSSDNIPGVPKVGEKTATQLLKEFGTLENILAQVERITKKALKESLKKNVDLAQLSKKLGTIVTNVPLELNFEDLKQAETDWGKVIPVFEQFEFDRLIKKYSQGLNEYQAEAIIEKKREQLSQFNFNCVKTEQDLNNLLKELENCSAFAFDLETTGRDPFTLEIVGISFSLESKSAYYVPSSHLKPEVFAKIFQSNKLKIGHNLKYDIEVLQAKQLEVKGPLFDTMVASYLLDPISNKHSLKKLAKQFLGREMINLAELIGKGTKHLPTDKQAKTFAEVPLELATDYACSDAESTFALYEIFKIALEKQQLAKLFYEIEMPLLPVLIEMEMNGVSLDVALLNKMSKEIEIELKDLERHIFAIAGEVFNLNSPKQLAKILFEKLNLPIIKRTKTGVSTDVSVLEELATQKFEIAEKLMVYRTQTKLKSTYVDVLPDLVHLKTRRIHTSFNQTITATGRLSSSNPNLQNIPLSLRSAFIPEKKDWIILAADYSQIELRILAHLSGDTQLLKAFTEDQDIHALTATEVFGDPEKRSLAKAVNFGIIYGISDFGLAKQLKIKKTEAAEYIAKYFNKHQGVKAFIDKTIADAREKGYVTTLLGRKRPLPDINSPNYGLRSFAERTAVNTVIQGTAADMIKIAMTRLQDLPAGRHGCKTARLLLQVHDELVFECKETEAEELKELIKKEMEAAFKLEVPVKVNLGVGANWQEAK